MNIQRNQVRQLEDMIETVKEDDKKKTEDTKNEFQAYNRKIICIMKILLCIAFVRKLSIKIWMNLILLSSL